MRKHRMLIVSIVVLPAVLTVIFSMSCGAETPQYQTAEVVRHEIKMVISTNGIIEPVDRSEVYAPIDGLVTEIPMQEGSEIKQGQLLMRLQSEPIHTALAETTTALLEAKRQAKIVASGPPREEITVLDAAITEISMQLDQVNKDLPVEESLLAKGAVAQAAVDTLRRQRDLLQLRLDNRKQQKRDLLERYSAEEKQWVQDKAEELTGQVRRMERQLKMGSITAPKGGLIYSLKVKPGAYVQKGQVIAQINQPGKVRLRAYVDEPDLGRIARGQAVTIEWDGMADRQWTGTVERPAEQVVELNNRSVGHVLCSIESEPKELIPNLNVNVEITTDLKSNVLTVSRSAVYNSDGEKAVMVMEGEKAVSKPVIVGLVTSEEIEILQGVEEGDIVVINPLEVAK